MPICLNGLKPSTRQTIFLNRQTKYQILVNADEQTTRMVDTDLEPIYKVTDLEPKPIRCRYLLEPDSKSNPDQVVILNAHGGGYMAGSPDSHESYLRGFARDIPGVPLISVDYQLSPLAKYPIAIQEILDVYLWLMSGGQDVQDLLGFQPKDVVVCGDSCGGLFSAILVVLVGDIRKQFDPCLKLPKACVAFYATFTVRPHMSPSMLLCPRHPYLLPTIFLACMQSYLLENWTGIEHLKPSTKPSQENQSLWSQFKTWCQDQLDWYFWWRPMERTTKSSLWFMNGPEIIRKKCMNNYDLMSHPYMSPLMYDDMDSLSQTSMYIIGLTNDPIADHSVMMARKWRGKVKLDMIDELVHAFLSMYYLSDKYRQGYRLCCDRLREAVYE